MIPPRRLTPQQMMLLHMLARRQKMGFYAVPPSVSQPTRSYTGQQAQAMQGLGRVHRETIEGKKLPSPGKRRKT